VSVSASGHLRIDRRSLALHQAVAKKLRAHPELIGIARENLDRWYDGSGRSRHYIDEWRRILDLPLEEVLSVMEQDGERMTALRQSSPFAGVLEPAERWAVYARFEPEHVRVKLPTETRDTFAVAFCPTLKGGAIQ
jgi:hypothetical protein